MKTALQILIDNYEKILSEPNPENEMYEQGLQNVINSAKTLLPLEENQIKASYASGADNVVDHTAPRLNQQLVSASDYFKSKYKKKWIS